MSGALPEVAPFDADDAPGAPGRRVTAVSASSSVGESAVGATERARAVGGSGEDCGTTGRRHGGTTARPVLGVLRDQAGAVGPDASDGAEAARLAGPWPAGPAGADGRPGRCVGRPTCGSGVEGIVGPAAMEASSPASSASATAGREGRAPYPTIGMGPDGEPGSTRASGGGGGPSSTSCAEPQPGPRGRWWAGPRGS